MILLIVASFAGIFFGLYHQILVLVPTTLAAAIVCFAAALLEGQSVSSSLFAVVVPAVGLQGGYMIGLTGRDPLHQIISRLSGEQSRRA
jgi:Na+/citrate or Na+/malate symporter